MADLVGGPVEMRRTYRFRLYPTRRQTEALNAQLEEACALYNAALQHRRDLWRDHGVSVSRFEQERELAAMRAEGIIDGGTNAWSQHAVLRRLDYAFAGFFRRVNAGETPGYPRFRSRRRFDTLEWSFAGHSGGVALTQEGRLRLQGVGHVKIKMHRAIPTEATLCEARVTRRGGRWYLAVSLKGIKPRPLPRTDRAVGIDLGITTFVATSDGERIAPPRPERVAARTTRRAARKVSRRHLGSKRRRKAAVLLARHREHETNVRRDHAHKTARALVKRYDVLYVEDLNYRGLAKGMLARDVHDQGWATFVAHLRDKAEDAGRQVVLVDARNTSQACSACGAVVPKALSERVHSCACGYTVDRDVNAARNVLVRGLGPDGAVRRERWGDEARAVV